MLTGADIELPAVPGASDNTASQRPFAEWSALVRTNAVEREELPLDVVQSHDSISGNQLAPLARRAIGGFAETKPHEGRLVG